MTATITAFESTPDEGRGLARDMRVRWAFEEVGRPYDVRLVSFEAMKRPGHLRLHPFGQIPTYEEGDLALFESGAIVLHIAERHGGLLPDDPAARARAVAWMFAALNTIEPPDIWRATSPGIVSACRSSTTAPEPASTSSPPVSAIPNGSTANSAPPTC
jgi:glutathione S-transferase